MVDDARQLADDHADVLDPLRNLDPEELLDRPAVAHVVHHGGAVVEAVRQGDDLLVGEGLRGLLKAPVEVTDLRFGLEDRFSLEPGQDAQGPVHGRVGRPDVQGHPLRLFPGLFGPVPVASRLPLFPAQVRRPGELLALLDRIVLAQGVPHEILVVQDPSQIRVPLEPNPVLIKGLPLEPVGGLIDPDCRGQGRILFSEADLEADMPTRLQRVEMVDDLEPVFPSRVVGPAYVLEERVFRVRVAVQEPEHLYDALPGYTHGLFVAEVRGKRDGFRELLEKGLCDEVCQGFESSYSPQYLGSRIDSPSMIFWILIRPSRKASGVGGHPGTYTSTGMIVSIP